MILPFQLQRQLLTFLLLCIAHCSSSQFVEEGVEKQQFPLNPGLDQTLDHVVYSSFAEPASARHVEEKKRLLASLERNEEDWTVNHPRYRLLQALHGFVRYKERYQNQVKGWVNEYESLPEAQKKVEKQHYTFFHNFFS